MHQIWCFIGMSRKRRHGKKVKIKRGVIAHPKVIKDWERKAKSDMIRLEHIPYTQADARVRVAELCHKFSKMKVLRNHPERLWAFFQNLRLPPRKERKERGRPSEPPSVERVIAMLKRNY
jgi:hypothetical protein